MSRGTRVRWCLIQLASAQAYNKAALLIMFIHVEGAPRALTVILCIYIEVMQLLNISTSNMTDVCTEYIIVN